MDASVLAHVLRDLPAIDDPNVLVGTATADDAGVVRVAADLALVQTVDFFTPIVDDPRTFGRIAAANALSDVYAMGGRPVSALAIAAFPEDLDPAILGQILLGGSEKAREAGISVIGGHTVKDSEPKYGLAVTGLIHPDRIVHNHTARAGDALVLTKPIGTGLVTTARRRDLIDDRALAPASASMEALNRAAAEAMLRHGAHAATDITGFGLIGHLREMTQDALGARLVAPAVPLLDGALELAAQGAVPGGTRTNLENALAAGATFAPEIGEALRVVLCDAQTSGGLLIAVAADQVDELLADLRENGIAAARIGELTSSGRIEVTV